MGMVGNRTWDLACWLLFWALNSEDLTWVHSDCLVFWAVPRKKSRVPAGNWSVNSRTSLPLFPRHLAVCFSLCVGDGVSVSTQLDCNPSTPMWPCDMLTMPALYLTFEVYIHLFEFYIQRCEKYEDVHLFVSPSSQPHNIHRFGKTNFLCHHPRAPPTAGGVLSQVGCYLNLSAGLDVNSSDCPS